MEAGGRSRGWPLEQVVEATLPTAGAVEKLDPTRVRDVTPTVGGTNVDHWEEVALGSHSRCRRCGPVARWCYRPQRLAPRWSREPAGNRCANP
jgi:hypothetical protein